MIIRELAGPHVDTIERLCHFYRKWDGRELYRFDSLAQAQDDWVDRWERPPGSIAIWSLADELTFKRIEELEERLLPGKWVDAGCAPALGYMAGEDLPQLLWLVFKSLYFSAARPALPDAVLLADKAWKHHLPSRDGHTISAAQDEPELVFQPIDALMFLGHGRSFDAHLQKKSGQQESDQANDDTRQRTFTLCSRPHHWPPPRGLAGSESPARAVCHLVDRCFREHDPRTMPHDRRSITELQARFLFLNSCASWRLTGELAPASNLAIRALDSWCCGFMGSRYEKTELGERMYLALAAWKAGRSLGEILKLLSPGRVQLYSLLGDPELKRLAPPDPGYEQREPGWDPDVRWHCWSFTNLREGVISVSMQESIDPNTKLIDSRRTTMAPLLGTLNTDSGTLAFFYFDECPSDLIPAQRLSLFPIPVEPEAEGRRVVPQFTDPADRRCLLGNLLGLEIPQDDRSERAIEDLLINVGRQVQRSYGPVAKDGSGPVPDDGLVWRPQDPDQFHRQEQFSYAYWPGPVQEEGLEWDRQGPYQLSGPCFSCGLPTTMKREVLVRPVKNLVRREETVQRHEHYCPHCYQITHLPCDGALTFQVPQEVRSRESFSVRLIEVPTEPCILWASVFQLERSPGEMKPVDLPDPISRPTSGDTLYIKGGLPLSGLHFIRIYACRVDDLTLYAVGSLVKCY